MKEYYGLYGKANAEASVPIENKPLQQLSENDISKQIDNELEIEKENDLEWWLLLLISIIFMESDNGLCEVCCHNP